MSKWYQYCAAGCGKLLKMGSVRPNKPVCADCRRRRGVLLCQWCGMPFRSKSRRLTALYCCQKHQMFGRWLEWHLNRDEEAAKIQGESAGSRRY